MPIGRLRGLTERARGGCQVGNRVRVATCPPERVHELPLYNSCFNVGSYQDALLTIDAPLATVWRRRRIKGGVRRGVCLQGLSPTCEGACGVSRLRRSGLLAICGSGISEGFASWRACESVAMSAWAISGGGLASLRFSGGVRTFGISLRGKAATVLGLWVYSVLDCSHRSLFLQRHSLLRSHSAENLHRRIPVSSHCPGKLHRGFFCALVDSQWGRDNSLGSCRMPFALPGVPGVAVAGISGNGTVPDPCPTDCWNAKMGRYPTPVPLPSVPDPCPIACFRPPVFPPVLRMGW